MRWSTTGARASTGPGRRSGRPVRLVRDRALPGNVERRRAKLGDRRVIALLLADPGPVAGEVVPQHHLAVDQPEVAARHQQPGRGAPGQPADLLAGGEVVRGRDVVLEPDVVGNR